MQKPRLSGLCSICCASTDKPNDGKQTAGPREPNSTAVTALPMQSKGWKNEVQGGTESIYHLVPTACTNHMVQRVFHQP